MNRSPCVVVIGLDGADRSLLELWMAAGELPHLARLIHGGASGSLRSTIRPESSVAWTTFGTGVNPGRHSIFGFARQQPGTYSLVLNNSRHVRAPTLWALAGQQGKRVAVINVPMTYPPHPVNGLLVSGMLTPNFKTSFTYPPQLGAELLARVPGYRFSVDRVGLNDPAWLVEMKASIEARLQATLWLLGQEAWDLFVVVFTAPDRLQHFLWSHWDPQHPRHDPAAAQVLRPSILACYRALDQALGEIVAACGVQSSVWIISDHGFAGCYKTFSVNSWLVRRGGLTLKPRAGWRAHRALWLRRLRQHSALRWLKRALPWIREWRPPAQALRVDPAEWVDWPRTRAFFSDSGGIRINLQGREPWGTVAPAEYDALCQEIAADLRALRDPETEALPISNVYRREELYDGPYIHLAPDLIVEPVRDHSDPARNYVLAYGVPPDGAVFDVGGEIVGNHTLNGICVAWGQRIEQGARFANARLVDIAPTICYDLGLPVPTHMEGRVLREAFRPRVLAERPVRRAEYELPERPGDGDDLAEGVPVMVEERLRGLGYIG